MCCVLRKNKKILIAFAATMSEFVWAKCGCRFNLYEVKMFQFMNLSKYQKDQLAHKSWNRDLCRKHAKEYRRNNIAAAITKQKDKKREAQRLLCEYKERKKNLQNRLAELDLDISTMQRQDDGTYGKPDDHDVKKIYYDTSYNLYCDRSHTIQVEGCLKK